MAKKSTHIETTDLGNGYVLLKAEAGYDLYSLKLRRVVPEAVVEPKRAKEFEARKA